VPPPRPIEVSFCVVNTEQRDLLRCCLQALAAERRSLAFPTEVLVLDNASTDGSAELARSHAAVDDVVVLAERRGKAENDTRLLRRARGRYALLVNEDTEVLPGATAALHDALERDPGAGAAGAQLVRPHGTRQASAWRFPTPLTALAGALFLHRRLVVQSRGRRTKRVDWAQSAALMVRTTAACAVGYLDPRFFLYSDDVDFCKRLRHAGWRTLYVPAALAVHHEQLSTGALPGQRIVELSRNRDRYMRKHHAPAAAAAVRWLVAWTYALRAAAALLAPRHSPRRYWRHVMATLLPRRGDGVREAADAFNRSRAQRR
jgi:N-acetylglucosaminyl-diphospho-decaprenol L-rhamnosyltransferase